MPMCIHCATPIASLYMRYGRDHIVLTPCTSPVCSPSPSVASGSASAVVLADSYLEHDLPIVIIDLILAKPAAYRHLLFNRSSILRPSPSVTPHSSGGKGEVWALFKRILALGLVDAYIRWFYLCVQPPAPPSPVTAGRLSGRLVSWARTTLPVHAGLFFPSAFTPRTNDKAVQAVCSATPLWSAGETVQQGADAMLPTLVSYANVLLITLIETLALQLCVGLLTRYAIRTLSHTPSSTSKTEKDHPVKETPDPLIGCKALLLSQLSPLLLLSFVLLWSSKFPHSHQPSVQGEDRSWMVWIIRTFLASLNAGVAIATVLPTSGKAGRGRWWSPLILGAAWTVQAAASAGLYSWLS
ncbi:Arv1 protein [Kalmanozyma brasiliensis GHG001]|uniref:Arv1 protein n=1 Tax=Kalmanozyma brasiliensis (strain GHG001) TaxID=1365824 RepID=UPI0028680452|nr:Arv1 protein [Kalmanozyma brasiliensis GHG001]KAF6767351.1 Arv1 protein [Kalmanozyma brasiliensis GHG001]